MKTKISLMLAILMVLSFSSNAQRGNASSRNSRTVSVDQKANTNRGAKQVVSRTVRKEVVSAKRNRNVTVERGRTRTVARKQHVSRTPHISRKQVRYKRGFEQRRVLRRLPARYTSFYHNGLHYHYANGHYYRPYGSGFVISFAPVGYVVNTLPLGYVQTYCGGVPYFYFSGVYYQNFRGRYRVVTPPQGALVYQLPFGTEEVIVNGRVYYEYAGVLYKGVETINGMAYEVAGQLQI